MIARKNIMEKAAHGSSGVNELKTCEAGLLTSAKKSKNQLRSPARRITKYVILFSFIFLGSLLFSDLYAVEEYTPVRYYRYYLNGSSQSTRPFSLKCSLSEVDGVVFPSVFSQPICFKVNRNTHSMASPSYNSSIQTSLSLNFPFECLSTNSTTCYLGYTYLPKVFSLFSFCSLYYFANPSSSVFSVSGEYVGCIPQNVFHDLLLSTNSLVVSTFLDEIRSINTHVDENGYMTGEILDILLGYVGPLRSKPFIDQIEAFSKNQGIYSAYIPPEQLQLYKDTYNSIADSDPLAAAHYADSILGSLNSAQSLLNLKRAMSDVWPRTTDALDSLGQHLTDHLNQSVNQGFSASSHIQGATTNLLQKMTNQTEQIKQDLQAWRTDATNRLERQWDGIKKIRENTDEIKADSHVTASGVSKIANDGVKIIGPIQVVQDTGQRFSVNLTDANLSTINNSIASGANEAMQMWLDEWESFKLSQLPYMSLFSGFFHANTNLLSSIDSHIDSGFTNTLDSIYIALTNGLGAAVTNDIWDYYFDRFKKANEFKDDDGQLFTSIDNQRQLVFGNGFDDAEYKKLDWFSRVELLLYQIGYASTNGTESIEAPDLEGEFDDVSDEIQIAASAFEGAARRVVGVFSLVGRFADAVKNAFADVAAPSTDGILLLEGGSWIFQEPLYLRVPVLIQNSLRLVFQCVWYLSAFVIGWRLVSFAWGRVASLVRWLWSLIDV